MSAPNVRFSREIREGMRGSDVVGHKRALSRARPDLYQWTQFTDLAGPAFLNAVVAYKKRHRLGPSRVLGGVTHESLERQHRMGHKDQWAFDAVAVKQCDDYYTAHHSSEDQRRRLEGLSALQYWYAHKGQIAYSQWRPFQMGKPPWVPTRWDCSAAATNAHYAAGGPDPNGRGYDGQGYTGTLMNHGTRVGSVSDLKVLDLVFYYYTARPTPAFPVGSPTHVAVYAGSGMVYSMGSYPMGFFPYTYGQVNHFRHYTLGSTTV